jgi:hypothetical protein
MAHVSLPKLAWLSKQIKKTKKKHSCLSLIIKHESPRKTLDLHRFSKEEKMSGPSQPHNNFCTELTNFTTNRNHGFNTLGEQKLGSIVMIVIFAERGKTIV